MWIPDRRIDTFLDTSQAPRLRMRDRALRNEPRRSRTRQVCQGTTGEMADVSSVPPRPTRQTAERPVHATYDPEHKRTFDLLGITSLGLSE